MSQSICARLPASSNCRTLPSFETNCGFVKSTARTNSSISITAVPEPSWYVSQDCHRLLDCYVKVAAIFEHATRAERLTVKALEIMLNGKYSYQRFPARCFFFE